MTKSIDYYIRKIVSASDGPKMALLLCDDLNIALINQRSGKANVFKKMAKSKTTECLHNLELAISVVMRQSNVQYIDSYVHVLDRIHKTGLDPLFKGPLPPHTPHTPEQSKIQQPLVVGIIQQ